jgi:hypothetical protein
MERNLTFAVSIPNSLRMSFPNASSGQIGRYDIRCNAAVYTVPVEGKGKTRVVVFSVLAPS